MLYVHVWPSGILCGRMIFDDVDDLNKYHKWACDNTHQIININEVPITLLST